MRPRGGGTRNLPNLGGSSSHSKHVVWYRSVRKLKMICFWGQARAKNIIKHHRVIGWWGKGWKHCRELQVTKSTLKWINSGIIILNYQFVDETDVIRQDKAKKTNNPKKCYYTNHLILLDRAQHLHSTYKSVIKKLFLKFVYI